MGPDPCPQSITGYCNQFVTDLSSQSPYSYIVGNLTAGKSYYFQVLAHNKNGYGYPAITAPASIVPTFNPPDAPPPVRLVKSTVDSITVEWDYPRENGGVPVQGFELWMDDWAGGNPRLIFDGVEEPETTQFTVSTYSSLSVVAGNSYRFFVRAINYCIATNDQTTCYSPFSEESVFVVRAPRVPLPPPIPYRSSKSTIGAQITSGDSQIVIRWKAPIDNGGSEITDYFVYVATPGQTTFTEYPASSASISNNNANGKQVMEFNFSNPTFKEGDVYRFYIVAKNSVGKGAGSPILSIVAGMPPGTDANRALVYDKIQPSIKSVDSNHITVSWPMPSSNSSGGTPITGYKLFMYTGVGLNTLANPKTVFQEVQKIQTSFITGGVGDVSGSFSIVYNGTSTVDLPHNVSVDEMKASLEDIPGLGTVRVTRTDNSRQQFTWEITFEASAGNLPLVYCTQGRISPNAVIRSTTVVDGTRSRLVYDGTGVPDVRSATVSPLIDGMTYSFKVAPLNAISGGILSAPSLTVVATSGSSATYTTASGSSLISGITNQISEEQIINATNCITITVSRGSKSFTFSMSDTESNITSLFNNLYEVSDNSISVSKVSTLPPTELAFRVIFKNMGDVPLISAVGAPASCASTTTFLEGNRNQFTIEPKQSSGRVLKDILTAQGFAGRDDFLVEMYQDGKWHSDQGVARYNPLEYEIMLIEIPTSTSVKLNFTDYMTPNSKVVYETASISSTSTAREVQQAIEALPNIDSVDVSMNVTGGNSNFRVTFLSNLGPVPLFTTTTQSVIVTEVARGVCEVQTITIANDQEFNREKQFYNVSYTSGTTTTYTISYLSSSSTITFPATNAQFETAVANMIGPNSAPIAIQVSSSSVNDGSKVNTLYDITFISPIGDTAFFTFTKQGSSGDAVLVSYNETSKGSSPISGTFTVFYEGAYTVN